MQIRALVMLAIAIIIGGVAAYLVNMQLKQKMETAGTASAQVIETKPVVLAAINMEIGNRLAKPMLEIVNWPADGVPEGAYTSIDEAIGENPEEPRIVLQAMQKGEVVLPYKLSGPGGRGGLAPHIPDDMRAVTISVNEIRGVAGFVLPGNHVDLLLTSTIGQGKKEPVTRVLLQDVVVLAVAQQISQKKDDPQIVKSVTLLVTPKQGQLLTLAQSVGAITLVLRKEGDTDTYEGDPVTLASLLSSKEVAPPPGPTPEKAKTEPAPKPVVKKIVKRRSRVIPRSPSTKVDVIRGLSVQQEVVKPEKPTESSKASGE